MKVSNSGHNHTETSSKSDRLLALILEKQKVTRRITKTDLAVKGDIRSISQQLRILKSRGLIEETDDGIITVIEQPQPQQQPQPTAPLQERTRRTMIKLRYEERATLTEEAAQLFVQDPSIGIRAAIEQAIENVLPEERRPSVTKAMTWSWLRPSIQAKVVELRAKQRDAQEQKPEVNIVTDLSSATLEQLIREVAHRLVAGVIGELEHLTLNSLDGEIKNISTPLQRFRDYKDRDRKPRVVVIGLLKSQERHVRRDFGDEYDLRFCKPNTAGSATISNMCRAADYVVGMISFMSHAHEAQIKKTASHYIRVPGGMTDLHDKLTELYVLGEPK